MKTLKRMAALVLCLMLLVQPVLAASLDHGTADMLITEDMLKDTPPGDYSVNKATQGEAKDGEYNAYFLEDTIQTVSIRINENNLNYLLQNAEDEPYVMTDSVTIGDVTLGYCGLKTKGSYTLEHSVTDNAGSDRFSFTVNFGKYIKKKDYGEKQNFYGCDKISFNNFFFDKSMMKEFFALKLMDEMGLPTPRYGLAKLYINGEYYGVYAMVEAMDSSIIQQYYETDQVSSYLTKPEGTRLQYEDILEDDSPLWEYDEDTRADVEDMLPTVTEWVRKLNCLSEGRDFEGNALDVGSEEYLEKLNEIMNVDEVVRYFAAHSWLCQMDNIFVGRKNYGLYISEEGICTVIPWDYDLSFGCYYPSTAEATANYGIDVMFQMDVELRENAAETAARFYQNFPLFNVIYQNETLRQRYYGYMKDCSKVAALGGTVEATGKTYDPGFFNSYIEKMSEAVIKAASEELADNVYYMNGIRQPNDVKLALPNLSKIIAYRAVGVLAQVDGLDTRVCAADCNLETLGNALRGGGSNSGNLTIVDSATGIFATAEFQGSRRSAAPSLVVTKLEEGETYESVKAQLSGQVTVYELSNKVKAVSGYTVTIPLGAEYLEEGREHAFYSYADGVLTELTPSVSGNLFTVSVEELGCIVVAMTGGVNYTLIAAAAAGVVVLGLAAVLLKRKKGEKA